jgi:AbrB family looped-hinge helix DNA binding protein
MRTTTRLFNGGKVTVPAQIRKAFDIEDGDLVEIDVRPVDISERNSL